jgi:hypothetical protein
VNKAILHTALTGKLQLELEYRQPSSKENSDVHEELSVVEWPHGTYVQPQTAEEFFCLLHVI